MSSRQQGQCGSPVKEHEPGPAGLYADSLICQTLMLAGDLKLLCTHLLTGWIQRNDHCRWVLSHQFAYVRCGKDRGADSVFAQTRPLGHQTLVKQSGIVRVLTSLKDRLSKIIVTVGPACHLISRGIVILLGKSMSLAPQECMRIL